MRIIWPGGNHSLRILDVRYRGSHAGGFVNIVLHRYVTVIFKILHYVHLNVVPLCLTYSVSILKTCLAINFKYYVFEWQNCNLFDNDLIFFIFQKIVIFNKDSSNSVVRTCGEMCNETLAGDTLTTCCQENLCNSARTNTRGTPETILSVVLMFAGVSVLADIMIWR